MKSKITAICEEFSDHFVVDPNEVTVFLNMLYREDFVNRLELLGCKLIQDNKRLCFHTLVFTKPSWTPTKYLG